MTTVVAGAVVLKTWILITVSVVFAACGAAALANTPVASRATWLAAPNAPLWLGLSALVSLASAMSMILSQHITVRALASETGQSLFARVSKLPTNPIRKALARSLQKVQKSHDEASHSRKSAELQLNIANSQRRQAEAILLSISDAVLVTDPFDQILIANDAAARLLGFELAACNRIELSKLIDDKKLCQLITDARAAGNFSGRRIVEHRRKHAESEMSFKVTLSAVNDADGEMSGIVTVLHDMTKEREVAEMKNEFVSNVSHELRTPLASIRAYVEMLIDGEADDEKTKRNFYEVIQNEANRLGRLIDNILNISRIESGLVKISQEPQSLTVIAKEAIEVIAPQAKLKQIKIDEQLTPIFYQTPADRDMIYQAMLNLLSNAVKYTPENGTVTVQTTIDEARRCVVAKISDTGVGIPPKDLPFVFDKFYRAEANNKMAKGTGLGLSLVKHIIETVHSGRMFVDSVVGQGSTFGFELALSE